MESAALDFECRGAALALIGFLDKEDGLRPALDVYFSERQPTCAKEILCGLAVFALTASIDS